MANLLNKFADKIHSKDGTNESENITDQQNLQRQRGAGGQQWDSRGGGLSIYIKHVKETSYTTMSLYTYKFTDT